MLVMLGLIACGLIHVIVYIINPSITITNRDYFFWMTLLLGSGSLGFFLINKYSQEEVEQKFTNSGLILRKNNVRISIPYSKIIACSHAYVPVPEKVRADLKNSNFYWNSHFTPFILLRRGIAGVLIFTNVAGEDKEKTCFLIYPNNSPSFIGQLNNLIQ